ADHDRAVLRDRDRVPSPRPGRAHRQLRGWRPRLAGRIMSESFEFVAPDHFTAGAVGPQGQRIFYLQSREKGRGVALNSENAQVRDLDQYVAGLLGMLPGV